VEIPDDAISHTGPDGSDLLNFALVFGGKTIRIHYPTFGDWNQYTYRVAMLLRSLSTTIQSLELPAEMSGTLTPDAFPAWSQLVSHLLLHKRVQDDILEITAKYLRPEVDGFIMPRLFRKRALRKALAKFPMDSIVRLLCALLVPEAMLKKNVQYALKTIFQTWTEPQSTPTFTTSTVSAKNTWIPDPILVFN